MKAVVEPSPVKVSLAKVELPDPPPEEAKVILSPEASVVSVIPLPATSVKVSVVLSATTLDCPLTAIVENKFCEPPPPEEAKVIVSPDAFVVIVMLLPATKVSVSAAASATTSS